MQHIIKAELRENSSKGKLKELKVKGNIPAVVYGNNKTPISIYINARNFHKEFSHISESTLIDLIINDETKSVLIKDYQKNNIRNTITHIDFFEVSKGHMLTTHVSIISTGAAEGVRKGGILEHFLHEVEIECLPKNLPERLEIDITKLEVGDTIYVKDLPTLEGVEYRSPTDQAVFHISAPKQVVLEPEVEEITEEETEEEKDKDKDKE